LAPYAISRRRFDDAAAILPLLPLPLIYYSRRFMIVLCDMLPRAPAASAVAGAIDCAIVATMLPPPPCMLFATAIADITRCRCCCRAFAAITPC